MPAPIPAGRRAVLAHPDLIALLVIVAAGAVLRLAFSSRAPVFFHGDSIQYYVPAHALMLGEGFPLSLKRPPVYPLLLALVGRGLGEGFAPVIALQHVLGLGTAALVYGVGRVTFGRGIGLLAGLVTALSGGLLIYEHYLLTEALFTFLLTLAVYLCLLGLWRDSGWCYAGSGLAIGLATLTRPHAQMLLLLVPPVLLLCDRRWRPVLRATALVGGAALLVIVPWMARNAAVHGAFTVAGALGQNLIANTAVFHNGAFVFYDEHNPPEDPNPKRRQARKIIQDRTDDKAEDPSLELWGISIHARLKRQLRIGDAGADALMRDVALEAIRARPLTYARLVFDDFWAILVGRPEELRSHWTWDTRYWPRELRHLVEPATPEQEQGLALTERLVAYQSPRFGPVVPVLFLIGLAASLAVPAWRGALLLGLTVLGFHLASAATVGFVPRYHHPVAPLMHVVAFGGVVFCARQVAALFARSRPVAGQLGRPERAAPVPRS